MSTHERTADDDLITAMALLTAISILPSVASALVVGQVEPFEGISKPPSR